MNRRAWQELRAPVSALVLLGLIARLLLPLPALAKPNPAAAVAGLLCLPSGEPADHSPAAAPETDHCALCRLPDAVGLPPPGLPSPTPLRWSIQVEAPCLAEVGPPRPLARGPPPARAPPLPTIG